MIRISAVLVFLLPLGALAQEGGLGLDLSGDQKPAEETPAVTAPEAKPEEGEGAEIKKAEAPAEHNLTEDDRVKSVQRKLYLKTRRFEFTPMLTASLNDPFFIKVGPSFRAAYYLADTLAVAGRGAYLSLLRTSDVKYAKSVFHSIIYYSVPQWVAMGDVEWSPLYGKVAIFNNILHFDAYLLGGLGMVYTETSGLPGRGPNMAVDVGVGLRFVTKDWLAVNVSVLNTAYVDAPGGTTNSTTQNLLTVNAGLSVFFPFRSTSKEAE